MDSISRRIYCRTIKLHPIIIDIRKKRISLYFPFNKKALGMNIVCCTDHNYIMPTGVMICSACVNHTDVQVTFYVVCNSDVTESDKDDLRQIVS